MAILTAEPTFSRSQPMLYLPLLIPSVRWTTTLIVSGVQCIVREIIIASPRKTMASLALDSTQMNIYCSRHLIIIQ